MCVTCVPRDHSDGKHVITLALVIVVSIYFISSISLFDRSRHLIIGVVFYFNLPAPRLWHVVHSIKGSRQGHVYNTNGADQRGSSCSSGYPVFQSTPSIHWRWENIKHYCRWSLNRRNQSLCYAISYSYFSLLQWMSPLKRLAVIICAAACPRASSRWSTKRVFEWIRSKFTRSTLFWRNICYLFTQHKRNITSGVYITNTKNSKRARLWHTMPRC